MTAARLRPAFAAAALLFASCSRSQLSWPIKCTLGRDCSITNFPDPHRSGFTSVCKSNSISGHEGTDIVVSQEQMDRGVDVLAAADGTVQWMFDGKFDRCPNPSEPDCADSGEHGPGSADGAVVCTPLGPFCRDGAPGDCYWCFAGGNVVVIRHDLPGVFATRYDHLKKGSILVHPGDKVTRGQKIAEVGSAGHSTAPHLHFEVWGGTFYDPVDPWQGPCKPWHRGLWINQPKLDKPAS